MCPALDHRDSSASLNQHTWAQRGWCRTERMVREVTAPKKALILLIESPKHLAVLPAWESNFYSPGLRLLKGLETVGVAFDAFLLRIFMRSP